MTYFLILNFEIFPPWLLNRFHKMDARSRPDCCDLARGFVFVCVVDVAVSNLR